MTPAQDLVFLLDVDSTLLDDDRAIVDLRDHLRRETGSTRAARFWAIFEGLRGERRHAESLGSLQHVKTDDKLRLLAAVEKVMQDRLTTVLPRQGHYALYLATVFAHPAADLSIERIGELLDTDVRVRLPTQEH